MTSTLLHETKENEILVTSLTLNVSVDYLKEGLSKQQSEILLYLVTN